MAVSMDSPSTFFWNKHVPLPCPTVTLVKLQASHFPNPKGVQRVLCEIAIDLSLVMNAVGYIFFSVFSEPLLENSQVAKART